MLPNYIRLTEAGKTALNNADEKGVRIQPHSFRVGEYDQDNPPIEIPKGLLGNEIARGRLRYIQVLNTQMVRFSFTIDEGVVGIIGEVAIYLKDGTCLGHATLFPKRVKRKEDSLLLELLLHLDEGQVSNIDVSFSEFGSVPSVASVDDLASPVTSNINAVSVLTLKDTTDGFTTAGLALRHGDGGQYWAFEGYNRMYLGEVGAGVISPAEFKPNTVLASVLSRGACIVQVVSGSGAGESRVCDYANTITCRNFGFSDLAEDSTLAIWAPALGTGGTGLPPRTNLPADYILYSGVDSPFWGAPPSSKSAGAGGKLYTPPSKLSFTGITMVGDGSRIYKAEGISTQDSNHAIVALNGIWQNRLAFEATGDGIEFAEELASDFGIDMRIASRQPTSGTFVDIKVAHHVADGFKRKFTLPAIPETIDDVFAIEHSILIGSYAYKISGKDIEFNEPPKAGRAIELRVLVYKEIEGYFTRIESGLFNVMTDDNIWHLPVEPDSEGHIFFTENGLIVTTDKYKLVESKVVFSRPMRIGSVLEFYTLKNERSQGSESSNIGGVMVGAIHTAKGLEILRHGMPPLRIPYLRPSIRSSEDILIEGTWPDIRLSLANKNKQDRGLLIHSQSNVKSIENSLELVWPLSIPIDQNCILKATADFSAQLGPADLDLTGFEDIDYIVQIKPKGTKSIEYGRRIVGSSTMGFSVIPTPETSTDERAYANASMTVHSTILKAANPAKTVEVLVKMRMNNVDVAKLKSFLHLNVSIEVFSQ